MLGPLGLLTTLRGFMSEVQMYGLSLELFFIAGKLSILFYTFLTLFVFQVKMLDLRVITDMAKFFSKYADLKLGKPDEKPEYNDVTWFMMLFACGIGVGLFFYGVAEPITHYTITRNRYSADPTMPDNTLAQIAINLTLYHWGM